MLKKKYFKTNIHWTIYEYTLLSVSTKSVIILIISLKVENVSRYKKLPLDIGLLFPLRTLKKFRQYLSLKDQLVLNWRKQVLKSYLTKRFTVSSITIETRSVIDHKYNNNNKTQLVLKRLTLKRVCSSSFSDCRWLSFVRSCSWGVVNLLLCAKEDFFLFISCPDSSFSEGKVKYN